MEITNSNSGRVFVLGAGASAVAGYPLGNKLLEWLREHEQVMRPPLTDTTTRKTGQLFYKLSVAEEEWKRSNRVVEGPSIETLLTHLEIYRTIGRMQLTVPDGWNHEDSELLCETIGRIFRAYQHCISHALRPNRRDWEGPLISIDVNLVSRVGRAWAAFLHPGDTLISFNWDLLHEVILHDHGRWKPADGYGHLLYGQLTPDSHSPIRILKLHGSANFYREQPGDSQLRLRETNQLLNERIPGWLSAPRNESGTPLILPTYLKDISRWRPLTGC